MKINITFRNDNPNTIWNRLAEKLGRQPTNAEAIAEVQRGRKQLLNWLKAGGCRFNVKSGLRLSQSSGPVNC